MPKYQKYMDYKDIVRTKYDYIYNPNGSDGYYIKSPIILPRSGDMLATENGDMPGTVEHELSLLKAENENLKNQLATQKNVVDTVSAELSNSKNYCVQLNLRIGEVERSYNQVLHDAQAAGTFDHVKNIEYARKQLKNIRDEYNKYKLDTDIALNDQSQKMDCILNAVACIKDIVFNKGTICKAFSEALAELFKVADIPSA